MRFIDLAIHPSLLLCVLAWPVCSVAQDTLHLSSVHHAEFTVRGEGDTSFVLPHPFIIQGSERVMIDSLLLKPEEFSLDARFGLLTLHRVSIQSLIHDTLA